MARNIKDVFRDEKGITSVGMAVSMMLCLTLIFSGAQLYRTNSAASEVQEVADVAALAAESEVSEFMIAVKVCDAAILSMTLLAATIYGIGIVCACVPPLEALSAQLISLATRIRQACESFYDAAVNGLNALQQQLPFLAAAAAASVAASNNNGSMSGDYKALAVLVPQSGVDIGSMSVGSLSNLGSQAEGSAQSIREKSAHIEELSQKATEAKMKGWLADCGNAVTGSGDGRCMQERANQLASLSSSYNPTFSSVETWSFQVAIDRARNYYTKRQSLLPAYSSSTPPKQETKNECQYKYYGYCIKEFETCSFSESDAGVTGELPKLFNNTAGLRSSWPYNTCEFPYVSATNTMHGYSYCPGIGSETAHMAQVSLCDSDGAPMCPECEFTIETFGEVGNATSHVPTGFEYHYEQVRQAFEEYKAATNELIPLKQEVKNEVSPILDGVRDVISEVGTRRIAASPPGSAGAIVMVVNTASNAADTGFENMFVGGSTTLGARAAVSAAAPVEDASDDSGNVITSLLDGFGGGGGAAVGGARIVLDCWSKLLSVYENGQASLNDALEDGLNSISVGSSGGLGTWAADTLRSTVDAAGLAPANLKAIKPALINTGHVANADSGAFAVHFKQVKADALAASSTSTDVFTGIATNVADSVTQTIANTSITIAEIEFPVGDITIPITLSLPQSVSEAAGGLVSQCLNAVTGAVASVTGTRAWQ